MKGFLRKFLLKEHIMQLYNHYAVCLQHFFFFSWINKLWKKWQSGETEGIQVLCLIKPGVWGPASPTEASGYVSHSLAVWQMTN